MDQIFFSGWFSLMRTLVIGVLAYVALVILLRFSGKRTLAKMNAFDLVVTVALGSTLATVLLSREVALAEGVLAFLLLVGLQFAVTWSSVRWEALRRLVKSEPTLLVYRGEIIDAAVRSQRVTENEIRSAIRAAHVASISDAGAVVLETDGTFTVLRQVDGSAASSLADVAAPDHIDLRSTRSQ